MSVRWRLTAWYAGTMLVCGALLLGVAYIVVSRSIDDYHRDVAAGMERRLDDLDRRDRAAGRPVTPRAPAAGSLSDNERAARSGAEAQARARQRRTVATRFTAALGALALLCVAVGWLAAGRALRPVARLTATARRVQGGRLDERIGLDGPRDELKELADTFDAMLERLEHAFAAQRRFVADASHELRTPLSIMRAELEATLADPAAGEPQMRAMADVVAGAVQRMERLIEALLQLARSESRPLAGRWATRSPPPASP
jgi:signal transduction histidine kinase